MSLLRCEGLGRLPWIEGFDLAVEAGEAVCVRGPSGSGKTLLLRALADLDPIDAGHVSLDGIDREALTAQAWRRQVRYVHQTPPRLPGTVADAFAEAQEISGASADPLDDLPPSSEVSQLSGGEAQRLFLHLALATRPRVLLLDEPTASLDGDRVNEILDLLTAFQAAGGALVIVTHDDGLADRLGGREVRLA